MTSKQERCTVPSCLSVTTSFLLLRTRKTKQFNQPTKSGSSNNSGTVRGINKHSFGSRIGKSIARDGTLPSYLFTRQCQPIIVIFFPKLLHYFTTLRILFYLFFIDISRGFCYNNSAIFSETYSAKLLPRIEWCQRDTGPPFYVPTNIISAYPTINCTRSEFTVDPPAKARSRTSAYLFIVDPPGNHGCTVTFTSLAWTQSDR